MRSRLFTCLIVFALATLYVVTNPHYYGNAVWFALDIKHGAGPESDISDVLWHPLGYFWAKLFILLTGTTDPLVALQWFSAIFAGAVPPLLYVLAKRFGCPRGLPLFAAAVMAGSHFSFAYGGSGCPYPAAVAFAVAALIPLVQRRGISRTNLLVSALCAAMSCLFWGAAVLLIPCLALTASLWSRGALGDRLGRALAITGLSVLFAVVVGSAALFAWSPQPDSSHGLSEWLTVGTVPHDPWLVRFARAAFAPANALLHFESLSTSIKGLLLQDYSIVNLSQAGESIVVATLFALFTLAIAIGIVRLVWMREYGRLILMTAFIMTLYGLAAVTWFDSEVERFSLALPLIAISIITSLAAFDDGTSLLRKHMPLLFTVFMLAANFCTFLLPGLLSGGGLVSELSCAAGQSMPPGSLIVVSGQYLGGSVAPPVTYFTGIEMHNILVDIQEKGIAGWDRRLSASVAQAEEKKGRVAVLSDLLGSPTPSGIGLSPLQFPEPSVEQIAAFFQDWKRLGQWRAGPFLFIELAPPVNP